MLTNMYLNYTMELSNLSVKHPWMPILPDPTLVKLVRYHDVKELIPEKYQDLHIYFNISPINFMYPMFFFGTLLGYAFRSLEGKEFTVKNNYPMIGFMASRAVYDIDSYKGGKFQPLILVEGVSDAEAVSKLYPWVLAVMGNKVKNIMAEVLPWYVNKAIILFDNDDAGRSGAKSSLYSLKDKMDIRVLEYPSKCPYKDPAEIMSKGKSNILKRMIKSAIR